MNALVDGAVAENSGTIEQILGEQITPELANDPNGEPSTDPKAEEPREIPLEGSAQGKLNETSSEDPVNQDDVPDLEPAGEDESDDEEEESDSEEEEENEP
jgi:hypothetical protein